MYKTLNGDSETVHLSYFDQFGITPEAATAAWNPSASPAPQPASAPTTSQVLTWLQANSTAVFIASAAAFVLALVKGRR